MRPSPDAPLDPTLQPLCVNEGAVMHWMDGWNWVWMSFMMVFWIAVLGAVIYFVVRLTQRPPGEHNP